MVYDSKSKNLPFLKVSFLIFNATDRESEDAIHGVHSSTATIEKETDRIVTGNRTSAAPISAPGTDK